MFVDPALRLRQPQDDENRWQAAGWREKVTKPQDDENRWQAAGWPEKVTRPRDDEKAWPDVWRPGPIRRNPVSGSQKGDQAAPVL